MLDELDEVAHPLAQRWKREHDRRDAMIEVDAQPRALGAEALGPVRRGDDPHVDRTLAGAADAPHLPGLEHAQEVRLQLERQLAELVEEQRPAVRLHEVAVALGDGAGERARS